MSPSDSNNMSGHNSPSSLESPPPDPTSKLLTTGESEPGENEPLILTLGMELEFLFAVRRIDGQGNGMSRGPFGRSLVRKVLQQPMEATCVTCSEVHEFQLPVREENEQTVQFSKWNVDQDASVALTSEEAKVLDTQFFDFYPIELQTRVLSVHRDLVTSQPHPDTGHIHEISCEEEVEAVMRRLRSAFGLGMEHHIIVNSTCGFHVHVGNDRRGFPLRTVKKILALNVANERSFDSLHATSRIGGSTLPLEPLKHTRITDGGLQLMPWAFNNPLSTHKALISYRLRMHRAGLNPFPTSLHDIYPDGDTVYPESHLKDRDIDQAAIANNIGASLVLIERAPELQALQDLQLDVGHYSNVNLENLADFAGADRRYVRSKVTIEFRQHAGTLQIAEILAWVDVVVSMVSYAHAADDADFKKTCGDGWQTPNCNVLELLKTIWCADETIQHYAHKLGKAGLEGSDYASEQFKEVTEGLDAHPSGDPLIPLLRHVAHESKQETLASVVRERIDEKLKVGGYGQFPSEYLDKLDIDGLNEELKEKLTIGWFNNGNGTARGGCRSSSEATDTLAATNPW